MFEVAQLHDAKTTKELYERLRDHIGKAVLIRRVDIERAGVLTRLSYNRNIAKAYYSFESQEREELSCSQQVAVRLDGVWRIIHTGDPENREL